MCLCAPRDKHTDEIQWIEMSKVQWTESGLLLINTLPARCQALRKCLASIAKTTTMTTIEFTDQLDLFQSFLWNFAMKLTQNQETAKDLMQDTALRAFSHKEKFQKGSNFKAWIATIMRNIFINQYRQNKKRKQVAEPIESFIFAKVEQLSTSNHGESNLRIQEIMALFIKMSDIYSIPFWLHYKGFEYKEIAEKLELPVGTIKSRIHTARSKLKARLAF